MRWSLILSLILTFLPVTTSHAIWPTSIRENLPIAVNPEYYDGSPKAFLLPDDQICLFKISGSNETGLFYELIDQYGEFIFPAPRSVWPAFEYAYVEPYYKVASDSSGGFLICWEGPDFVPNAGGTRAQRINSEGDILWGDSAKVAFAINSPSFMGCADGLGNYYFVVGTNYPDPQDIRLQKLDSDGYACWGDSGLAVINTSNIERYPHVIPDNDGGVIVTWEDHRPPSGEYGALYAQRFDADGQSLWQSGGIPLVPEGCSFRQELPDGNNGLLLHCNPGGSFSMNNIFRFDSNGQLLWELDNISKNTSAQMVPGEPGFVYLGFIFSGAGDRRNGMYGQRIGINGQVYWPWNNRILGAMFFDFSQTTYGFYYDYAFSYPYFYGLAVKRSATTYPQYLVAQSLDIYGHRRYGNQGSYLTVYPNFNIGEFREPNILPSGEGGAVAIWFDISYYDIWAKSILPDGSLGGPIMPDVHRSNSITTNITASGLSYSLPTASHVIIDLFNVLGQKVQTVSDGFWQAGDYTIEFDALSLVSGVYFARLQAGQEVKVVKVAVVK